MLPQPERKQMSLSSKLSLFAPGRHKSKPAIRYFDETYYLRTYPEVADYQFSPLEHYLFIGWRLRYDPSAEFSTDGYLNANPDVSAIRMNPLLHFLQHGLAEGRKGWDRRAGSRAPPSSDAGSPDSGT